MGTRLLWVDPTLLVDLYKAGPPCVMEAVENPLPPDATLIGVRYDLTRDACALVLESAAWPAVPVGTPLPEVPAPAVGVHYDVAARLAAWEAFAALMERGMRVQAQGLDTGDQVWANVRRAYFQTLRRLGLVEAFNAQLAADEGAEEPPPDLKRWWALPEPVAGNHHEAAALLAAWAALGAVVGWGMRVQVLGQSTELQAWRSVQEAYRCTLRRLGLEAQFDAQLEADVAAGDRMPDLEPWWTLLEPGVGPEPGQRVRGRVTSEETLPPLVLEGAPEERGGGA